MAPFIVIFGWISGALVNYLADVLPLRRRPVAPFCLGCEAPLSWQNYLFWPRRCPACGRRRAVRVWLVELAGVCVALWLWFAPPARLPFLLGWLVLVYLGVIVVIDIEYRVILHPVSLAGVVIGLLVGAWLHGWISAILGGLAGFGVLLAFYLFGMGVVRVMGWLRRQRLGLTPEEGEALGFGDVNLAGVIGLLLGWPGVIVGLLLGILIGGAVSLLYLLAMIFSRRYRPNLALPYGPFLAAGAVLVLFFGDNIRRLWFP